MGIMNVATFAYSLFAARMLAPGDFGAFTALLAVLLVVNVLSLGLQATGARRISANPTQVTDVETLVLRVGIRCALGLSACCLVLIPVFDRILRLDSLTTAAMVALAAAPLTVMGAQAGVLQGERRWVPLALVYLASGLGRIGVGVPLVVWHPTDLSAVAGVALGAWAPIVVGGLALRRPRTEHFAWSGEHGGRELFREVALSSQALLGFFVLSSSDILLARVALEDHASGLYAAGLIMVKAMLFLPQFVVVIAFPAMSRSSTLRTLFLALGVIAALGLGGVAGAFVLPELALQFVGGGAFREISTTLPLFAAIGTLLSMIQMLIYSSLAKRQVGAALALWTGTAALVAFGGAADSATDLAVRVALVDAAVFAALMGYALISTRSNS